MKASYWIDRAFDAIREYPDRSHLEKEYPDIFDWLRKVSVVNPIRIQFDVMLDELQRGDAGQRLLCFFSGIFIGGITLTVIFALIGVFRWIF